MGLGSHTSTGVAWAWHLVMVGGTPSSSNLFEGLHPAGPWLWVAVGGAAGGAALLAAGAGLAFYVQSTACKKGEYNVQEAESSGEAVCLNGTGGGSGTEGGTELAGSAEAPAGGEVFAIQLTSA